MSSNLYPPRTVSQVLIQKLDSILNPTREVWAMRILLPSGIACIGYPNLVNSLVFFQIIAPDVAAKLPLCQETSWLIPILGVVQISFVVFLICRNRVTVRDGKVLFRDLKQAAMTMRKYLDDNRRIFMNCGPNSSVFSSGDARMDMGMWENLKQTKICPNNIEIKTILNSIQYLNQKEKRVTAKMLSHIDAFQAHCENPNFDYSNNRFPLEFSDLIYEYCKQTGRGKSRINKYSKWLTAKIPEHGISVESIILFGSALYGEETLDVDCLIKSNANSDEEVEKESGKWQSIENSFETDFGFRLHLIVACQADKTDYDAFLLKLPAYEEVKNNG